MASHLLLQPTDDTESDFAQVSYSDYLSGLSQALEVNSDETKMNTNHDARGRFGSGASGGGLGGDSGQGSAGDGDATTSQIATVAMTRGVLTSANVPVGSASSTGFTIRSGAQTTQKNGYVQVTHVPTAGVSREVRTTEVAQKLSEYDTLFKNAGFKTQLVDKAMATEQGTISQVRVYSAPTKAFDIPEIEENDMDDEVKLNRSHDRLGRFSSGGATGTGGGGGITTGADGVVQGGGTSGSGGQINLPSREGGTSAMAAEARKFSRELKAGGSHGQTISHASAAEIGGEFTIAARAHTSLAQEHGIMATLAGNKAGGLKEQINHMRAQKANTDAAAHMEALAASKVGVTAATGSAYRASLSTDMSRGGGVNGAKINLISQAASAQHNLGNFASAAKLHTEAAAAHNKQAPSDNYLYSKHTDAANAHSKAAAANAQLAMDAAKAFDIPEMEDDAMDDETKMNRNHDARGRFGSGSSGGAGGGGGDATGAGQGGGTEANASERKASIATDRAMRKSDAANAASDVANSDKAKPGGAAANDHNAAAEAHREAAAEHDKARQIHFDVRSGIMGEPANDFHNKQQASHSSQRDVHNSTAREHEQAARDNKSLAMDDETKMNRNHDARGRFSSGGGGGGGGGDGAGSAAPSGAGNTGGTAEPTEAVRRVQAESRDANGSSADMGFMPMGKIAIIQGQIEQGQTSRAIAHHKQLASAHDFEAKQQAGRAKAQYNTERETIFAVREWRANNAASAAHRAVVASLEKLDTAPKSFDIPDDESLQIYTGFEVKALGNGKVGGYLVRYSQASSPDLVGDYFTDKSDLGTQTSLPVLYHHGQDKTIGKRVIGTGTLRKDDVGVWVETQLALRDDYEKHIYKLAEQGKLGWSSGSVSHLVERETKGKGVSWVKSWWVAEASLTPTPAEPQNHAFTKGHQPPNLEDDLLEESDDGVEPTADIVTKTEDTEMSEETIDELKAAIAGLTKRLDEPKVEAGKMAAFVKTVGGDHDGGYAFKHWIRTGVMNSYTKNNEQDWTATKTNVLNETTGTEGGILVPEGLYTTIIAKRDEMSIIRANGAMVIQTNLDSVQVPVENARMTTAIVAESGSYVAAEPTFTSNVVPIYKFGNQLRLTDELVSDEQTNIMGYLSNGLGRAFGLMENQYCIAGTGSAQPKGLLTGGTAAITAASTTAITAAELVSLYHALPEPYTSNPSEVIFVTRNATLGALRALASSSIFTFNLQPQGDQGAQQLYGHKVAVSGYMEAATTGKKSILVTNLAAGYIMCERAGMVMQRNPYLLQATGQIALFSTMRFGGTTTVAEATQILTQA